MEMKKNTADLQKEIWVYNRQQKKMEQEKVLGDSLLRWAYESKWGAFFRMPLFGTAFFSRLLGCYANSCISKKRIKKVIRELEIEMSDVVKSVDQFRCFNDFFTRKLKPESRPYSTQKDVLISPAECRILVYPALSEDRCIPVKGMSFTLGELLGEQGKKYVDRFKNGSLAIFRLCPIDYHRYHFPDSGSFLEEWKIKGKYHSVNPIALAQKIKVFTENVRQVSMLELQNFGLCAYVSVGAFGVGSIISTQSTGDFQRKDEKGMFAFGGSTLVLIFEPGKLTFSKDILEKSAQQTECLVKIGETIASR